MIIRKIPFGQYIKMKKIDLDITMPVPMVCFECRRTIGDIYISFWKDLLAKKPEDRKDNRDICDRYGIIRMCCKTTLISSVPEDQLDQLLRSHAI